MNRTEMLLVQLAEECAEVQQQCCKALRFGLNEIRPQDSTETNSESITRELEDLEAIIHMLQEVKAVEYFKQENIDKKIAKVEKYLNYSICVGTLKLEHVNCKLDLDYGLCPVWESEPHGCTNCGNYQPEKTFPGLI
jgi:hypothetical protein